MVILNTVISWLNLASLYHVSYTVSVSKFSIEIICDIQSSLPSAGL